MSNPMLLKMDIAPDFTPFSEDDTVRELVFLSYRQLSSARRRNIFYEKGMSRTVLFRACTRTAGH